MDERNRFSIRRDAAGGVCVVSVTGEVDLEQSQQLTAAFAEIDRPVVVDLRRCDYMGADALRSLLEGRRLSFERGHRFVLLVAIGGAVARLLEVVGARTIFNLRQDDDLDAAVAVAGASDRRRLPDRRTGADRDG